MGSLFEKLATATLPVFWGASMTALTAGDAGSVLAETSLLQEEAERHSRVVPDDRQHRRTHRSTLSFLQPPKAPVPGRIHGGKVRHAPSDKGVAIFEILLAKAVPPIRCLPQPAPTYTQPPHVLHKAANPAC